jgi:hypothetical protein
VLRKDYEAYFRDLAHEQNLFLSKLDNHAYEIIDKVYPDNIMEMLRKKFLPNLDLLTDHISDSAYSRTSYINEVQEETNSQVQSFIDDRELFYSYLEDMNIGDFVNGVYEIPCFFYEIEHIESGKVEIETFFPWDGQNSSTPLHATTIELEEAVYDKVNYFHNKTDSKLFENICDLLENDDCVPAKEIARFREDCSTIIMED